MLETIKLRVSEIFFSLQGETSRVGLPTVFIRLTGCPLRCGYCDTAYAFSGGESLSIPHILNQVARYKTHYVTVTGGEPLSQKPCLVLMTALCEAQYSVSIETSGALDVSKIDKRVCRIMDIKTPGSGEMNKNNWQNLVHLTQHDEIKFVICDENDYRWTYEIIHSKQLLQICPILLSPAYKSLPPETLATWILRDALPVRMQIQMHKLLWGEGAGH